jgi:putative Mg2+ transporter-C (MgtC) family protein
MILLQPSLVRLGLAVLLGACMEQVQRDPTRIVSWILIGSGLLGVGSLLGQQGRPTVTALFTAATFWVVAVIGVLCGAGWLGEAVGGALLTLSIGLLYRLVKRYSPSR